MAPFRPLTTSAKWLVTTSAKWLAFELIALVGAVAYFLLSSALPEIGAQMLAGVVLVLIMAAVGYRLVQVLRDPVGAIQRRPKK